MIRLSPPCPPTDRDRPSGRRESTVGTPLACTQLSADSPSLAPTGGMILLTGEGLVSAGGPATDAGFEPAQPGSTPGPVIAVDGLGTSLASEAGRAGFDADSLPITVRPPCDGEGIAGSLPRRSVLRMALTGGASPSRGLA